MTSDSWAGRPQKEVFDGALCSPCKDDSAGSVQEPRDVLDLRNLSCSWLSPPRGSPVIPARLPRINEPSGCGRDTARSMVASANRRWVSVLVGRGASRKFRGTLDTLKNERQEDAQVGGNTRQALPQTCQRSCFSLQAACTRALGYVQTL